jgi:methylisocitrate lyase
LGLEEAIARGKAYRKAGADVIFVELKGSLSIVEELKRVTREIEAPCLVNVEEAGGVGDLAAAELDRMGYRLAIYPGLARYAAGYAIREALGVLKVHGSTKLARSRMLSFKDYNDALKLNEVEAWEKAYMQSR